MSGSTPSGSGRLAPAIEGCLDACGRCSTLVDLLDAAPSEAGHRAYAAIGVHLRHCVDHVECLLQGLDAGLVDYDDRERDAVLEQDSELMRRRLAELDRALRTIDPAGFGRQLHVRQSAALGVAPVTVESNLERELLFLSGHTIHHLAIMTLLVRAHGIGLPTGLDIAFSTAAQVTAAAIRP
jgi:hypothetical protein